MPPQEQLVLDNRAPPSREQGSARSGGVVALLSRAFSSHGRQSAPRLHESSSLLIRTSEVAVQPSESSFFSNSRGVDIQGGHFESHNGPSFHVTINTGSHPQEQTNAAAQRAGPSVAPAGGSNEHQDMRGYNERSSYANARNNESFTTIPPILPIQRPCDIYYRHLSVKGRGSPLWLPAVGRQLSIDYRRKGISIGDVGIITFSGSFDFLFNILLPADHPIHGNRVPGRFTPLDPPLEAEDIEVQEEFAEDSYLASASVKKAQNNGQGSSSALRFETTNSEGAILAIPKGSDSSNLLCPTRFSEYVDANLESWYCYANGKRGRQAQNGDLRLITGWDKAKAWGMATFSRSSSAAQSPIQLDFKPLEQTGRTYKWEYSGIADGRTGPSIRESNDLRLPGDPEDVTFTNQCLFIRTINPLLSKNIWKRLEGTKFAAVKSEDSGTFNSNSGNSEVLHSGKGKGKAVDPGSPMPGPGSFELNSVVQSFDSATALLFHPSTAINEHLLNQNPGARTAITEDINWISALTEDDYSLPPGDQILRRVMERHEISEENGIVFLRQLAKSNTSDYFSASKEPIDTFEDLPQSHNLRERGNALARSFDQGSRLNNFEEAISLYNQALAIIPSSDIDYRGIQSDLAEALLYRFHLFHQFNDLNEAIGLYIQDPELQAPSHPIRFPEIYSNIGNAIVQSIYQRDGPDTGQLDEVFPALTCNMAGLEECILLQRLALELLPPSHPHRPSILDALAGILTCQIFQILKNETDRSQSIETDGKDSDELNKFRKRLKGNLDEIISLRRQSLELLSSSDPDASQLRTLLSLAESLYLRYQSSDQLCDLDEAIHAHRQILTLLPSSHPCQPTILKCLATELSDRYTREKQPSDLDEAILLFEQYLRLPPPFRPDRPDILYALSEALFELRNTPRSDMGEDILLDLAKTSGRWYFEFSTAEDGSSRNLQLERLAEKAIFFQRLALEFLLPSDPRRADILCDLAEMLLRKANSEREPRHEHPSQQTESQLGDVRTEAVSLYRQALELTTPLHPRQLDILRNFSELLVTLYEDEGELALLEEAILLQNQALELRTSLHTNHHFDILNKLAYALACRYDEGGEMTDLYDSISFNKQALESCPTDLPPKKLFAILSNLGDALACRFEVEGQIIDLEEAIILNKQAIELPLPFREIQAAFLNMQKFLSRRTQHSKEIVEFFNSDELKDIAATIISTISSFDMDISQIDSSLLFMLQNKSLVPHGDEHKARQTLATASQPDVLKSSVAASTGSQSSQGSISVNLDKLLSQILTDEKQGASPYKKDHEQNSLNDDTTPTSSDLSTEEGMFTAERRRRLSSSSVVSDP